MTIDLTITITQQPTQDSDDEDCAFGTVDILGVPHHVTLIEVKEVELDNGSIQEGLTYWGDNCLAAMHQFESTNDDFQTITVGDRTYVICITPFLR